MSPEDTAAGSPQVAVYPRDREVEIVLRDGSTVHVRPVRREDRPAIRAFLATRFEGVHRLPFLRTCQASSWVADWAVDVDYADRFALVAESGTPRQIVAHARVRPQSIPTAPRSPSSSPITGKAGESQQ